VTLVTVLRIRRPRNQLAVSVWYRCWCGLAVAVARGSDDRCGLPQASYTVVVVTVGKTAPFRSYPLDVFCETYGNSGCP